ncbi:right-handed parallel beta-helix repeat-containing protein [Modestobacter lapidis]|nr:hypothetical protein [Modestobacter lapidis]
MQVQSELSARRLVGALLTVAMIPAVLAVIAVSYQRPALPPGPADYNPVALHTAPVLAALQARELQRSRRMADEVPGSAGPRLVPGTFPEPVPTVVLPPRATPYDLAEVQRSVPAAFGTVGDALLVRASIEVPAGAQLDIDGAVTPEVRLFSAPSGFATIIARGGTVAVRGTAETPVAISSWDPDAGAVDEEPADGRAFLLAFGGRMDIAHADVGHLGFGTGTSSGLAWRGADHSPGMPGQPALGDVSDSVLHHNWFGAYTFEAHGMQWTGNRFADNAAYGFDPHDLSNDFLVEGNVAHGNGRHGFIFSRGCDRNVLRNNVAYDNRGHGFMIDDGRSEDSAEGLAARLPSNDNVLVGNRAYDNDGSGIEIEGGTGTVVQDNVLERNHIGVRIKNDASALVEGNEITDSRLFGVDVLTGAGEVDIQDNDITGGWASISLGEATTTQLVGNELRDASTPMVVAGVAERDISLATTVGRVFRWNPLLVLWTAILGVPAAFALRRLGRRRMNVRQS